MTTSTTSAERLLLRVFGALALGVGLLGPGAARAIDSVVVLKSDDLSAYEAPVRAFQEAIGRPVTVLDIQGQKSVARDVVTRLRFDPPPLVFALGAKAAWMVHEQMPRVPLVYGMIQNPRRYGLVGESIAGVAYEIPYDILMSQIQLFLPEVRKVGVILTNQNPAAHELRQAAEAAGLELEVSSVQVSRDVRGACVRLSKRVDAVLVVNDPEVLTPENFRFIREQTRRRGIPVLATSEILARAGALLSVVPDYRETGVQAAALAHQILDEDERPERLPTAVPEGARVVLNRGVLRSLDLDIDPLLLDFTDEVIEDEIGR
ncbi:MAG: ABC transporter substrate binding protein [Pseudomonadota bacterium]